MHSRSVSIERKLATSVITAFACLLGNATVAADFTGFWKLTEESIQTITDFTMKHRSDDPGDGSTKAEIAKSYRDQVREFKKLEGDAVLVRLIQMEDDGDRFPEYYRDFELTYVETENTAFTISRGEREIFSGELKNGMLHLKDSGTGNTLYFKRLTGEEVPDFYNSGTGSVKLDRAPKARKVTTPEYPPELKSSRIEGSVEVEFMVNTDGTTSEVHVVSSTNPGFEGAAIEAILSSNFRPAQAKGKAVRTKVKIPITFR
jgi:TonB family protein